MSKLIKDCEHFVNKSNGCSLCKLTKFRSHLFENFVQFYILTSGGQVWYNRTPSNGRSRLLTEVSADCTKICRIRRRGLCKVTKLHFQDSSNCTNFQALCGDFLCNLTKGKKRSVPGVDGYDDSRARTAARNTCYYIACYYIVCYITDVT